MTKPHRQDLCAQCKRLGYRCTDLLYDEDSEESSDEDSSDEDSSDDDSDEYDGDVVDSMQRMNITQSYDASYDSYDDEYYYFD